MDVKKIAQRNHNKTTLIQFGPMLEITGLTIDSILPNLLQIWPESM